MVVSRMLKASTLGGIFLENEMTDKQIKDEMEHQREAEATGEIETTVSVEGETEEDEEEVVKEEDDDIPF